MSSDGSSACVGSPPHAEESLGLSNCHISPQDVFASRLEAWALSPAAEKLNEKAHGEFLDGKAARDNRRRVRLYVEGTLIRIDGIPGWEPYQNDEATKRGIIGGYSCKARLRMLALVSSLNAKILHLFVTLTCPHKWDKDPLAWKSNSDTFGKWFLRKKSGSVFHLETGAAKISSTRERGRFFRPTTPQNLPTFSHPSLFAGRKLLRPASPFRSGNLWL